MKRNLSNFALIAAIVLGICLPGCMVGPNYSPPKTRLEPHYGELRKTTSTEPAAQASYGVEQTPPAAKWWRSFHDPELDRLIDEAVRKNYVLQIAELRVRQARAVRGMAASGLFPGIEANLGYNRALGSRNVELPFGGSGSGSTASGGSASASRTSATPKARSMDPQGGISPTTSASDAEAGGAGANSAATPLSPFGGGGLPGATTDLFQAGFDSTWELDIFGGTRRRLQAATAEIQAAVETRRDVMVSLLAEVARDYMELRGTQERLAVARQNLDAQKQIQELTQSMYKAGLVSDLDTTRAAAQVATTTSTIPPLEAQVRERIHALSTLLARQPEALNKELSQTKPLPPLPPQVPVGLPSQLLQRRPDIRAAERQIAAATARIGAAKADLFPKFSITGSMGLDSSHLDNFFEWNSRYFLFSPTVTWPIFSAGRIRSNIALQKTNQQAALLAYRNTILAALQEVEDALAVYATQQARRTSLTEALRQSRQALDIAQDQYKNGLVDFLTVLEAQRSVLAAQDSLAQSDESVSTGLVALYKSLGGGWQD